MIVYSDKVNDIDESRLNGFFVGWPNPPSTKKHKEILLKSNYAWVAIDESTDNIVGFITAISDGIISAYIPLLEVLPIYIGQGIGTKLTELMIETLKNLYMVDLLCDEDVMPFYDRLDMFRVKGMCLRNYERQNAE